MKVMHILDSLNRGGSEMLALDLCRNAEANHLQLALTATGGGDLEGDFRNSGVVFTRLNRRSPLDLQLVHRLRRTILQQQIDIVHTHQAVEALHAYLATVGTSVKRVMSFHMATANSRNMVALKLLVPRMDANVVVSEHLCDSLRKLYSFPPNRAPQIVYNGVDIKRLRTHTRRLRQELSVAADGILLGMIGNFYPHGFKDQLTICRALPAVFREFPKSRFVFIGGSVGAPQLIEQCLDVCRNEQIVDRVHFLGKRSDIADVINSLDVYVHSSTSESLGIAVIEAMLMGCPCVVSDIGGLREVSNDGKCADIFAARDAPGLAHKLISLLRDEPRRKALGMRGREWATRTFSIENHIEALKRLYERVLE